MRREVRYRPVQIEAICQRCGRAFTYVRRGRRRLRCSDCTVASLRLRSEAWSEANRGLADSLPAEYPQQLRRSIVAFSRALDRVMKHVDDLPRAHKDEALGLLLVQSIRRLDISETDGLPRPSLMPPMSVWDE